MARKENLNPTAGLAFGLPPEARTIQKTQNTLEVKETTYTLYNTRGRKGHKLPRINMAFTPENHEFITRTSRQQGKSATAYVNDLIESERKKG